MFLKSKDDDIFYLKTEDREQGCMMFALNGHSGLLTVIAEDGTPVEEHYFDQGRRYRESVRGEKSRNIRLFSPSGTDKLGHEREIANMRFFDDGEFCADVFVPASTGLQSGSWMHIQSSPNQKCNRMSLAIAWASGHVFTGFDMDDAKDCNMYRGIATAIESMDADMGRIGKFAERIFSPSRGVRRTFKAFSSLRSGAIDQVIMKQTSISRLNAK
jgi:hypothetical protein